MTDKTKEKIQLLCPDVMKGDVWQKQYGGNLFKDFGSKLVKVKEAPITLAVVLRAIEKANAPDTYVDAFGQFWNFELSKFGPTWNLEHDSYDQQIEECKQFIGNLLGV